MRAKLRNPQMVLVRPLKDQAGRADAFGDAPLTASGGGQPREQSFRVKMQIEWGGATNFGPAVPGRQTNYTAEALVVKRHIPLAHRDWAPEGGDILELASGRKLYVDGVEMAFPRRISKNHPDGGWDGWRLRLMDRSPSESAATSYE